MHDRIDVEGSDIATLEIFRVIFWVVAPNAAANVVIPRNALTEVQEDGPGWISRPELFVLADDSRRLDGWTVPFAAWDLLGIVRLVSMHPANDGWVFLVRQSDFVLRTNHPHSRCFQFGQLIRRRSVPQPDINVDACRFETRSVSWRLQPNCNGKEMRVSRRAVLPARIGSLFGVRCRGRFRRVQVEHQGEDEAGPKTKPQLHNRTLAANEQGVKAIPERIKMRRAEGRLNPHDQLFRR